MRARLDVVESSDEFEHGCIPTHCGARMVTFWLNLCLRLMTLVQLALQLITRSVINEKSVNSMETFQSSFY